MATDQAIAAGLAALHELYPTRDINPETLDAFALAFADWSDEEFIECAMKAAREPGREFFPGPGAIAAHRAIPPVNPEAILDRIHDLGSYNPNGWLFPRVEVVREKFGDAVADAYVQAGCAACFAPDARDGTATSREIARRTFARELVSAVRRSPSLLLPGSKPANPNLLKA